MSVGFQNQKLNPGPQGLVGKNQVRLVTVKTLFPSLLQPSPRILQDPLTGWLQKIPALPLHLGGGWAKRTVGWPSGRGPKGTIRDP